MRIKERLASAPLVTSEQSVELSSSYHNIISLKVPIAEAESESESDSDHQDDEETSDEEKNFQVSSFSTDPKVTSDSGDKLVTLMRMNVKSILSE